MKHYARGPGEHESAVHVKFDGSITQIVSYPDRSKEMLHFVRENGEVTVKTSVDPDLPRFKHLKVKMIVASSMHILILDESGTVYSTGAPHLIGRESDPNELRPIEWLIKDGQRVSALGKFMFITCNEHQSAAVGADGQLYVWGYNRDNVLHVSEAHWLVVPHHMSHGAAVGVQFKQIALQRSDKFQIVLALSEQGSLYLSGMNYAHHISSAFIKLESPNNLKAKDFCCKHYETILYESEMLEYNQIFRTKEFVTHWTSVKNISFVPNVLGNMAKETFIAADSPNDHLYLISDNYTLIEARRLLDEKKKLAASVNLRVFELLNWDQHVRRIYVDRSDLKGLNIILVLSDECKSRLMDNYLFVDYFFA